MPEPRRPVFPSVPWRSVGLAVALLAASAVAPAATLRVPADYPDIQAAIDAARRGDQVLVAAGTYLGTISFRGVDIELASESGPDATVLDGQGLGAVISITRGETRATRVSGFTIRNGSSEHGAGVTVEASAPVIEGNVVTGNHAVFYGGGIGLLDSRALVRGNRIAGNDAGFDGGGAAIVTDDIGPASSVRFEGNLVEDNTSPNRGGGLAMNGPHDSAVLRNVFQHNDAAIGGGVISYGDSTVRFADNLVVANTSSEGGLYIDVYQTPGGTFTSNTIADNTGALGAQVYVIGYPTPLVLANNAIIGSNQRPALYCNDHDDPGSPQFSHNDIYSAGAAPASGSCADTAVAGSNLSVPPGFVSGANGRPYHLAPSSPLIDAGDDAAVQGLRKDLGGRPRVVDGGHGAHPDIGAYEFVPR